MNLIKEIQVLDIRLQGVGFQVHYYHIYMHNTLYIIYFRYNITIKSKHNTHSPHYKK